MRNTVLRSPYMVMASEVDLVNGSILFSPVGKLDPGQLFRYLRYTTDNRPAYETQVDEQGVMFLSIVML